jgi:hypothetical protein
MSVLLVGEWAGVAAGELSLRQRRLGVVDGASIIRGRRPLA